MRPRVLLPALALVVLAAPSADARRSSRLWATVNVCDTIRHPDTIGIRGSMPGSKFRRARMFMRFQVQYFRASDQLWHNLSQGGDSGFVRVGRARYRARQAGQRFVFAPPSVGAWTMRGAVTFEWRLGRRVVRHVRLLTTAGHRSSADADPPGYSAATCVIS
jgi:hypothetical protein